MDPSNPNHPAPEPQNFALLLALIGGDGAQAGTDDSQAERQGAGERYEALRHRLVRYFTWERCRDPELCADETFSRTARKLAEGEKIQNVRAYLFGVARVVSREAATRWRRESAALEELAARQGRDGDSGDSGIDDAARCLELCLRRLSPEQRRFILLYYRGNQGERIETRRMMAEEEGVGMNALRNRALRLRERLEKCTRRCLRLQDNP